MVELPTIVVEQLNPLIRADQVLLVGEVHGTEQYPALVAQLVDAAVALGLPVTVGLEIPCSEIPGSFGPFWTESRSDGRSSQAMADLIIRLADLGGRGSDVRTVFVDLPRVPQGQLIPTESQHLFALPRDRVMAEVMIEQVDARPGSFTVVLAGNVHTQTDAPRRRRNKQPDPMGAYLTRWYHNAVSLMGKTAGGQAWVLTGNAEAGTPRRVAPDRGVTPGAVWSRQSNAERHHGHVHIGSVTASPPYRTTT